MYDNLCKAFSGAGSDDNGISFITSSGNEDYISYASLYTKCQKLLGGLQKCGLKKGDELVFQLGNNQEFVYMFWACILGGIIPIPINVGRRDDIGKKIYRVWKQLKNPKLITTQGYTDYLKDLIDSVVNNIAEKKNILDNMIQIETLSQESVGKLSDINCDDIAYIQFSSGSTGDPKGVVLSHKNIITNVNAIIHGCNATKDNMYTLSWLPLTHDMGLIGMHITPLVVGAKQYLMTPVQFIKRPLMLLEKITQHKITMTSIPNFGYSLIMERIKKDIKYDWDLSSVTFIFNGSEMISYHLVSKFLDYMKSYGLKNEAMFDVYGMAEASLAVSFPMIGEGLRGVIVDRNNLSIGKKVIEKTEEVDNSSIFVKLGLPVQSCEIVIVDEQGKPVDELTVGNIRIRGDNVTKGYYRREELNKKVFSEDGWLDTGDLGFFKENNLVVIGRTKDVVIIHGQNYYYADLEHMALRFVEGQAKELAVIGCTVDMEEGIYVFVKYHGDLHGFLRIEESIRKGFYQEASLNIKEVISISAIPKTTSGKIQHFKLVKELQEGKFNNIIKELQMCRETEFLSRKIEEPITDVEKVIVDIFKEVLNVDVIGIRDNLFNYSIKSMQVYQIFDKLNTLYPNQIKISDLYRSCSIKEITDIISKQETVISRGILLPEEFRSIDLDKINFGEIQMNISAEIALDVARFLNNRHLVINNFIFSLISYMLWEVTGQHKICLSSMLEKKDEVGFTELDFEKTTDIEELFSLVKNDYIYNIEDILKLPNNRENEEETKILVCDMNLIGKVYWNKVEYFDMVWGIDSDRSDIILIIKYHCGKYNIKTLQILFDIFKKILYEVISLPN